MPKGTVIYEATNKLHFRLHAARHALSRYEYMLNMGSDAPNGSLYFVTDCIKSVNWGIATFSAPSTAYDALHLDFDEGSCRWEFRGKVEARVGPRPMDVIITDDEEPNQCVFLGGYKVMLQQRIWDKLQNGVFVESQGGNISSSPSARHLSSPGGSSSQSGSSPSGSATDPGNDRVQGSQRMHACALQGSQTKIAETCETSNNQKQGPWLRPAIVEDFFQREAPVCNFNSLAQLRLELVTSVAPFRSDQ